MSYATVYMQFLFIAQLGGKCVRVLEGHDRFVTSCGFSPDGKLLASGSNDKNVIIWDLTGSIEMTDDLVAPANEFSLSAGDVWPQYEKLCRSRMLQGIYEIIYCSYFHD